MAGINLKTMDVDALLKLRADIEAHLADQKRKLEQQLHRLGSLKKEAAPRGRPRLSAGAARRGAHPLKGKSRPAKFRDPETGKTWAGVGMRPRWLVDYETQGRKADEFAVADAVAARAKATTKKSGRKAGAKRGRPKAAEG